MLPLECEANLYYRAVDHWAARIVSATHSYWDLEEYNPNTGTDVFDVVVWADPTR